MPTKVQNRVPVFLPFLQCFYLNVFLVGSGKSHSIVGFGEAKGIVPIACEQIFQRIEETSSDDLTYKVETSMMEIYNEKV